MAQLLRVWSSISSWWSNDLASFRGRVAKPALENAFGDLLYGELRNVNVEAASGCFIVTVRDVELSPKVSRVSVKRANAFCRH
jgi:hypothetical protein